MKIKFLVLGVTITTLLFSCKKKNEEQEFICDDPFYMIDFIPLRDGNYWIYEEKHIDTLGNIISTRPIYDTVKIIKDTSIAGIIYKKITQTNYNFPINIPPFLRRKSGELIAPKADSNSGLYLGEEIKVFSIFGDTITPITCINAIWNQNCAYEMGRVNKLNSENITVPAGNFTVKNTQDIVIKNDNGTIGWPYWGTKRHNDNQFANNIGLIRFEIFSVSSTNTTVKELVSYHLN